MRQTALAFAGSLLVISAPVLADRLPGDIVGFGNAGTWVSVANPSGGFDPARLVTSAFGAQSAGWSRQDAYPRVLGDFNGDGRADVVGFGNAGVWADPWIGYV
jgi:hypothetical protein